MSVGDLVIPDTRFIGGDIGIILKIDEVDFESVLVHWLGSRTEMWEDADRLKVVPSASR